jgi:hypothetical protein
MDFLKRGLDFAKDKGIWVSIGYVQHLGMHISSHSSCVPYLIVSVIIIINVRRHHLELFALTKPFSGSLTARIVAHPSTASSKCRLLVMAAFEHKK